MSTDKPISETTRLESFISVEIDMIEFVIPMQIFRRRVRTGNGTQSNWSRTDRDHECKKMV